MASIRQVAAEAGVSAATVSRILSGDESFHTTEQTKARVLEAVAKLNYQLPSARTRTVPSQPKIGIVLAVSMSKYSDPFFMGILEAVEHECFRSGAVTAPPLNCEELENEKVLADFCSQGLDGAVLMERLPEPIMQRIRAAIPNLVTVDQPGYDYDGVGFDYVQANRLIMQCLLDCGYRRIGVIGGSSPAERMQDTTRMMVYREEIHKYGIPYDETIIKDCRWDLELCGKQAQELLSEENRPDAIFAGSDSLASVVLGEIYNAGLRCPEDIGVIGFNDLPLGAHLIPPLTTVAIPTEEIGRCAAKILLDRIRKTDLGTEVRKVTFPTRLIIRNSLRKQEGHV